MYLSHTLNSVAAADFAIAKSHEINSNNIDLDPWNVSVSASDKLMGCTPAYEHYITSTSIH